ncbi:septum formation protein [Jannaschia faecimaris]|uniref:Nucleoside triphosphate pyrophosphatase n=1 Tax=Jannaschia faecimaris TaxID=1244108 RepID=A0A1H3JI51_9RHOB|nr:nucleoside triphosphate pyrophosphatase [Jannaschia faecimaris]SDY39249.1 septum formation protein [Jannaschia faecimaris]
MLILASTSRTRQELLRNAAIPFQARPPRVDEEMVKEALLAEGHPPRNIADALAELKAMKVRDGDLVLGCDQVLDHAGALMSKPGTPEEAVAQLTALSGDRHRLHAAAVVAENGKPVWRHIATIAMTMRKMSDDYISDYVERNWDTIRYSAGSYTLEGEGARFFHRVDGDYFAVLGLPLLPLIDFLANRGDLRI